MEFFRHILRRDFSFYSNNKSQISELSYLTSTGPLVEEISCDNLITMPKYINEDTDPIQWLFKLNAFEFIIITTRKITLVKNGQTVLKICNEKLISCACYENSLFLLSADNTLDIYNLLEMKTDEYSGTRLYHDSTRKLPFKAHDMIAVSFYVSKVLFINNENKLVLFDVFKQSIVEIYEELDVSEANKIRASPLLDVIIIEKDCCILFYHLINKTTINEINFDFEGEKLIKVDIDIKSLNIFIITSKNNLLIFNLENREILQKTYLNEEISDIKYTAMDIVLKVQNSNENTILIHNSKTNSIHKLTYNKTKDSYETAVYMKGIDSEDDTSIVSFRYGTKLIFNENNKIYLTKLDDDTLRTEISFTGLIKRLNLTGLRSNSKIPCFQKITFSSSSGLKSRYCAVHDWAMSFYIIDIYKQRALPFLITILDSKSKITALSFTPDSNKIFIGTSSGKLELYRVETGIREDLKLDLRDQNNIVDIIFNTTTIDPIIITTTYAYKLKKTGFDYKIIETIKIDGGGIYKCFTSKCKRIIGMIDKNKTNLQIVANWSWDNVKKYTFEKKIKEAKLLFQFFVFIVTENNEVLIYDLLLKKKVLYFEFENKIKDVDIANEGRRLFCRFIDRPGLFCYKIEIENVLINNSNCDVPTKINIYNKPIERKTPRASIFNETDYSSVEKTQTKVIKRGNKTVSLLSNLSINRESSEFVQVNKDSLTGPNNNTLLEKYQKKFFVFSFINGSIQEDLFITKYITSNAKRLETEFFYIWFVKISIEKILKVVSSLFIKDKLDLTKINVKILILMDTLKFFRKDIINEPKYKQIIQDLIRYLKIPLETLLKDNIFITGNLNYIIG